MAETLANVGIEQLMLSPQRPRGYIPKPSQRLLQRVARHGVLEPIAVRPLKERQFEILSNAPTWVAAGQVGIRELPVIVHHNLSEQEVADIVADHYDTKEGDPIEEARALDAQLVTFGGRGARGSISQLARWLGLSRTQVAHALRLLSLPEDIQQWVSKGELSPGQARPLISLKQSAQQQQLASRIRSENLSARDAERLAKEMKDKDGRLPIRSKSVESNADVKRLEQRVTELVGCPFEIRGNQAVFDYFGDFEVLDGLLRRIGYQEEG